MSPNAAAGGGAPSRAVPVAAPSAAAALAGAAAGVEARLHALEARVGQGEGRSEAEAGGMRAAVAELQQENARLRRELSELSSHTTGMLSRLQNQMAQLLRMQADGGQDAAAQGGPGQRRAGAGLAGWAAPAEYQYAAPAAVDAGWSSRCAKGGWKGPTGCTPVRVSRKTATSSSVVLPVPPHPTAAHYPLP